MARGERGEVSASEVTARHVRTYLAELQEQDLSDSYVHGHARAIKTLTRFFAAEGYREEPVSFRMPRVDRKRQLVLSGEELGRVLEACDNLRDRAVVLLLVDSGLRASEALALDWGDLDIPSGIVRVRRGKGGKARSAVCGVRTRRALLRYR